MTDMGLFGRNRERRNDADTRPEPQPGQRVVTFEGLRMHCGGCQSTVEAALLDDPGVRHIDVDLKQQSATVIYDEGRTSVEALREAIEQVGFRPQSVDTTGE